jgi:hypothetical protein
MAIGGLLLAFGEQGVAHGDWRLALGSWLELSETVDDGKNWSEIG